MRASKLFRAALRFARFHPKRKGCGAQHQTGQRLFHAALRFARFHPKRKGCGAHRQAGQQLFRATLRFARTSSALQYIKRMTVPSYQMN
jgi:hypothetical protein